MKYSILFCLLSLSSTLINSQNFTVLIIPDTQFQVMDFSYQGSDLSQFTAQMDWIPLQKDALNLKFICHVGDVVDHVDVSNEWNRFHTGWSKIKNSGIPWAIAPGNHDTDLPMGSGPWKEWNLQFPAATWLQNSWAQETYPAGQSENNLSFFEASGMEFMVIGIGYKMSTATRDWAAAKLAQYPNKRAILICHDVLVYDNIIPLAKQSANVFLIVSGHFCATEWHNTFVNAAGIPIHEIMTDYQCGLNGYLRYYTFKPSENKIDAFTYSPIAKTFRTGTSSQFSWDYEMNVEPNITLSQSATIKEGNEDGKTITVTLAKSEFVTVLNKNNWTFYNLPAGVTVDNITRNSSTQATLVLSGNSTIGSYSGNITNVSVDIASEEITNGTKVLSAITGVVLTKYTDPGAEHLFANYDGVDLSFSGFGKTEFAKMANPIKEGINTSDNVGVATKSNNSETWAGMYSTTLTSKIDFSEKKTLKMKIFAPIVCSILLKLEDAANNTVFKEASVKNTKTNEWEELAFDFGDATSGTYNKITMFFDFGSTVGNTFYFDDIALSNSDLNTAATDNSSENIFLFPNPSSTQFNIANIEDIHSVKVLDIYGRIVEEYETLNVNTLQVGKTLSSGLFLVNLEGIHSSKTIKILKN